MNYFYIARFKGPHSKIPIGYEIHFDSTRHFVSVAELEKRSSNPFANEIADAAVTDGVCEKYGVTREIIKGLAQEGHFYIECPSLIAKEEEERVRKERKSKRQGDQRSQQNNPQVTTTTEDIPSIDVQSTSSIPSLGDYIPSKTWSWKKIISVVTIIIVLGLLIMDSLTKQSYTKNSENPNSIAASKTIENDDTEEAQECDPDLEDIICTYSIDDCDIDYMSKEELRIIRNAIFAHHGKIFKSQDLTDLFSKYEWYNPSVENVSMEELNEIEKANLRLIQSYENR